MQISNQFPCPNCTVEQVAVEHSLCTFCLCNARSIQHTLSTGLECTQCGTAMEGYHYYSVVCSVCNAKNSESERYNSLLPYDMCLSCGVAVDKPGHCTRCTAELEYL